MKGYTDLEQSKKLAEILPIESADMHIIVEDVVDEYCDDIVTISKTNIGTPSDYDIPCWSLAALLELTPNDVSLLHFEDVYQAVYDVKPYHITNRYDNPLDAAFEMICWLKENNKI